MTNEESRRRFLTKAAAWCALPAVASGCRKKKARTTAELSEPVTEPDETVPEIGMGRPALPSDEPIVRVRVVVMRKRGNRGSIRIGQDNQWLHLRNSMTASHGVAVAGPVTARLTESGWSIIDGNGLRADVEGREPVEFTVLGGESSHLIEIRVSDEKESRQYPGSLRLVARTDVQSEAFDAVNYVPVESYLPGVLAGELFSHWEDATYAAQAVAARSFACTEAAIFLDRRHYDVTDTAHSQVYLGDVERKKAHRAVIETQGLLLSFEDRLVSGYYSSCCGGVAARAIDAIGDHPVNDVPPLFGRSGTDVCTGSPVYQWKIERILYTFVQRLASYGRRQSMADLEKLSGIAAVKIAQMNDHGRPITYTIVSDDGSEIELSAEDFRRAANYRTRGLEEPRSLLKSSHVQTTVTSNTIVLNGFGFGHGVGLCQYGAQALAKKGSAYMDILHWYYPEVQVKRTYG